jgi:hypothetical protein
MPKPETMGAWCKLALGAGALSVAGCASIVLKPDVQHVTKVAVLSVYANRTVPEYKGRGVVTQWDDSFRMEVAEDALSLSERSIAALGWQVVSGKEVVESGDYQAAFKPQETGNQSVDQAASVVGGLLMARRDAGFFTPPGMHPIILHSEKNKHSVCMGNNCPPDPKEALAKMAQSLGVDAVVVVQFDYCYQGGTFTSLGGLGEAMMTAGSAIRAVSRDGKMVVDMDNIQRCGGDTRAMSKDSMMENGGNLVFMTASRDKLKAMFAQATEGSLAIAVDAVKKAIQ